MRKKTKTEGKEVSKTRCSTSSDCQKGFECPQDASKSDKNQSHCTKISDTATNEDVVTDFSAHSGNNFFQKYKKSFLQKNTFITRNL